MSRPSNIYLVRHGESEANADKGVYSRTPDWRIELTPDGYCQAMGAGVQLVDLIGERSRVGVYLSPYRRTIQTWEQIRSQMGYDVDVRFVKTDLRLREQERGLPSDREKLSAEYKAIEKARRMHGTLFYGFHNGESGSQVADRVMSLRETLEREFMRPDHPDNLIIIGHSFTMRVMIMVLCELDVDAFHGLRDPKNAEIITLRQDGDRYIMR